MRSRGAGGATPGSRGAAAARGGARPVHATRFDAWAASYDASQLQAVLYGRVHDAVLRSARRHVSQPGRVLDVGCGTGRLAGKIASAYPHAQVVGVDASAEMIRNGLAAPAVRPARFMSALAERLPFTDAIFSLVVITLSLSHWRDQAAGMAEVGRVLAPAGVLLIADIIPARTSTPVHARTQPGRPGPCHRLPWLITASGLRVRHIEPIGSVAIAAGVTLIAADKPAARPRR